MRTSVLATLLGLSLVACAGNITGGGGGDDDDIPETCGNGVVDPGEDCDGGAGCSTSCTTEGTPRVDLSVDKPTVSTELGTSNMITLTLTSGDGFTGAVNITASILDGTGAPNTNWIVAVNPPTVTVPANGTATAVATLAIPSDATLLAGSLKLDVTGAPEAKTISSTVTSQNQITFAIDIANALTANPSCVYPVNNTPVRIRTGTLVRFFNKNADLKLEIHSNNPAAIPHQAQGAGADDPITEPNTAYERILAGGAAEFAWYCHDHGPDDGNNPRIQVVP